MNPLHPPTAPPTTAVGLRAGSPPSTRAPASDGSRVLVVVEPDLPAHAVVDAVLTQLDRTDDVALLVLAGSDHGGAAAFAAVEHRGSTTRPGVLYGELVLESVSGQLARRGFDVTGAVVPDRRPVVAGTTRALGPHRRALVVVADGRWRSRRRARRLSALVGGDAAVVTLDG